METYGKEQQPKDEYNNSEGQIKNLDEREQNLLNKDKIMEFMEKSNSKEDLTHFK